MLKEEERIDLIQKNGFGIIQNKKWFSYGIDAVLISNYVEINDQDIVLDLGTGTGIIPLLISLRHNPSKIIAVEKQQEVCQMAMRSVEMNQLTDLVQLKCIDVNRLSEHVKSNSVDVVVTNPPYFAKGNALTNDVSIKAASRHETTSDLEMFIKASSLALRDKGRFYMVHRPMRLVDIFYYCRLYNLEPKTIQYIYPHVEKTPNIVLIKCVKNGNKELKYQDNIYVYDEDRNYTDQIKEIYRASKIDVF